MNAGTIGQFVAKYIDKSWPSDREEIYEIIRLGINKAWKEGKWYGMTAEFEAPIHIDCNGNYYFLAPPDYPVLLAINFNGKPSPIRDKYFKFHRNGRGDIPRDNHKCKWQQYIYDEGTIPTLPHTSNRFRVGVRSLGPHREGEKINIKGKHTDGEKIFTYEESKYGNSCGCTIDKTDLETVNGISLDIGSGFNYINNIEFSEITAIEKTPTLSAIEVIIIDCNNNGRVVARLNPNQRTSSYRKYQVPQELCSYPTIHGLFKIGQQELITSDSDQLIIEDEEALLCFCIGIYCLYNKQEGEKGASYILQGISILEKLKREQESPTEFPVQVDFDSMYDLPFSLRY